MGLADDIVKGNYRASITSKKKKKEEESLADQIVAGTYRARLTTPSESELDDIAPVNSVSNQESNNIIGNIIGKVGDLVQNTFQTPKVFEDGYDFGDITKTILGSSTDLVKDFTAGIISPVESVVDVGANILATGQDALGFDEAAKGVRNWADKDMSNKLAQTVGNVNPAGMLYNLVNGTPEKIINPMEVEYDKNKSFADNYKAGINKAYISFDEEDKESYEESSVFGDTTGKLARTVGQIFSMAKLSGGLGKATGTKTIASKTGKTALSINGGNVGITLGGHTLNIPTLAYAGGMSEGLKEANSKEGVTELERWSKAHSSGSITGITEGLFGMFGVGGNEFTDTLVEKFASQFSTKAGKWLANTFGKAIGETSEEVLDYAGNWLVDNQIIDRLGDADFSKDFDIEELTEVFALSFVGSFISQGGGSLIQTNSAITAAEEQLGKKLTEAEKATVTQAQIEGTIEQLLQNIEQNRDMATGLSSREQQVVDARVQEIVNEQQANGKTLTNKDIAKIEEDVITDIKKGYISTDLIESTIGKKLTAEQEAEIETQLNELLQQSKMETNPQAQQQIQEQMEMLENQLNTSRDLDLSQDGYLLKSYQEKALRREQYTYEETDNEKINKLRESASKYMNNTARSHEMVETIENLIEDTGRQYEFINTEGLREAGYDVEGKTINGLVDGDRILLNIDSDAKILEKVIGHETTHLLEGTAEYKALQDFTIEYAKQKGTYEDTIARLNNLYKGTNANVKNEFTADMVGDLLFTDQAYIDSLSAEKPNVFQRIYDYIKHIYKKATAGSKEARQLEDLKYKFDQAYKNMKKQTDTNTKYSVSDSNKNYETVYKGDGKEYQRKIIRAFKDQDGNEFRLYELPNNHNELAIKEKGQAGSKIIRASRNEILKEIQKYWKGQGTFTDIDINKSDIKYSLTDNQGRTLTKEQQEFFKDSKVRDENGNLVTVYHGTASDFTIFDEAFAKEGDYGIGFYFTDSKNVAQGSAEIAAVEKDISSYIDGTNTGKVMEQYLDIKNPSVWYNYKDINKYKELARQEGLSFYDYMRKHYDGIIVTNPRYSNEGYSDAKYYIVFNSNQIKNIDNTNPTSNPDIRYSLSEDISKRYDEVKNQRDDLRKQLFELRQERNDIIDTIPNYRRFNRYHELEDIDKRINDNLNLYKQLYTEQEEIETKIEEIKEQEKNERIAREEAEATPFKLAQNRIIQETNPMLDDYHTGIRSVGDIRTWEEAMSDAQKNGEGYAWGDFTEEDAKRALKNNSITIYSSYPIKNGVFVSTSYIQAQEYAGGKGGRVYSKTIKPERVAWINVDEGQYASVKPSDVRYSLSAQNEIAPTGQRGTYGKDVRLEEAIAPLQETIENLTEQLNAVVDRLEQSNVGNIDTAPVSQEVVEQQGQEAFNNITENEMPPSFEDLSDIIDVEGTTPEATVESPFDNRDIDEVGNRKVKAYQYENPEVRPYFQAEAQNMMYDLDNTIKGEKGAAIDELGNYEYYGITRQTTEAIAYLKDNYGYSYDQIRKGLNDIIEDNGKENNAVAKRIEFMLDERLREGYTTSDGYPIPPNQEYINFLNEKQITEYNKEAFNALSDNDIPVEVAPIEAPTENIVPEQARMTVEPKNIQTEQVIPSKENVAQNVNMDVIKAKERSWAETSTDSDVIKGRISLNDLDAEKITYVPITNKETLSKANAKLNNLGYEKALKQFNNDMGSGKMLKPEDITLGQRLMQEALARGDKATAIEILQDITILGTEIGQAEQALSIIQRMTPAGQLRMLEKTVQRGKLKGDKAFEGLELTEDMMKRIMDCYNEDGQTYDQDKLNEVMEEIKQELADQMPVTVMDKVNAWRYFSMLGNPKTHVRNIVSTAVNFVTIEAKNALARTIEDVAPIENKTKTWKPASDVVKDFAKQTTLEMKDVILGENQIGIKSELRSKRKIFKTEFLNKITNGNSNLMTTEDSWFSKPAFTRSLQEFLTANGISTQEDIQNNPELVEKGKTYALEQSQIAAFRQYSWLASKISEIEKKNAATQIAVGSVLPFKKTPINIAKAGLSYSPLGFAKTLTYDIAQVQKGDMEASTLIDHLAQNTTGTALTLIGYMLAQMGFLNGAGDDDKEGKYDYQLGKQGYSLNIGGNTYSLSWLSPIAMPMMVGANAHEILVEKEEWNPDVVIETLGQTLDPLSEMSFLSSLTDTLSSYESGGIQKLWGMAEAAGKNYVTQFVPTLSSQIAATLDDTKRTTKVSGDSTFKVGEEIYNQLIYKIPGLRQTLQPTTDIWGNEVKQSENLFQRAFENFIAPYSRKESIATEIDEELKDLYSQTGDNGILPNIPYNYVNYDGEKYKMSAEEYTDYKKTYGQTANDLLEDLFKTTTYKVADSEDRTDMVNDVYDYARDVAHKEYLAKEGVSYTNTTDDGKEVYKDNAIKGAIENDMSVDEYRLYEDDPEEYKFLMEKDHEYRRKYFDTNDTLKEIEKSFEAQKESTDDDEELDSLSADKKTSIIESIVNSGLEDTEKASLYKKYYNTDTVDTIVKSAISIDDYLTYETKEFKADKNAKGNSIPGSRKEKVINYVNTLDLDIAQKAILIKSTNTFKFNDYNTQIVEYVGSLDIEYDEKIQILEDLDMTVKGEMVYWD